MFHLLPHWLRSPRRRRLIGQQRTAADILGCMTPAIRDSLNDQQQGEVARLIDLALPKPAPKLVDLRFNVDLIFNRFFIVLFVGQDRRQSKRAYSTSPWTTLGNWIIAIVLLLGLNLAISVTALLLAYLVKSALNIDLTPGHFKGFIQ